jgi:hypothetical protein
MLSCIHPFVPWTQMFRRRRRWLMHLVKIQGGSSLIKSSIKVFKSWPVWDCRIVWHLAKSSTDTVVNILLIELNKTGYIQGRTKIVKKSKQVTAQTEAKREKELNEHVNPCRFRVVTEFLFYVLYKNCRSRWPRRLRHELSSLARTLAGHGSRAVWGMNCLRSLGR